MVNNKIGSATATIGTTFASGTLMNLNELNGGGILNKTTGGTLTLSGVNTYTGNTVVNAGILVVANSSGSATGAGNVTLNGATLARRQLNPADRFPG